ncbi:MAG UNVERIFIED_CONTAM: family 10 glycosylhydrolase [Microcystis novacekii LVE1205-3]
MKSLLFWLISKNQFRQLNRIYCFRFAPNPYEFAYNGHLQDWLGWVRQGLVDELIVQVYRPDLPSFLKQIERPEIQETQQTIPTVWEF